MGNHEAAGVSSERRRSSCSSWPSSDLFRHVYWPTDSKKPLPLPLCCMMPYGFTKSKTAILIMQNTKYICPHCGQQFDKYITIQKTDINCRIGRFHTKYNRLGSHCLALLICHETRKSGEPTYWKYTSDDPMA